MRIPTRRLGITACVLLAFAFWSHHSFAVDIPHTYDDQIEEAVADWWPDYPYPVEYKAQLYQESRLDPNAESGVGAVGLAQFMPGTWDEVIAQMGSGNADRHEARMAIQAGAYYMAKMRRIQAWRNWKEPGRQQASQAAYNAGAGHITKAVKACGAQDWTAAAVCLPAITGKYSRETIVYVQRIARWVGQLENEE